jgi:hypothetical protein
MAITDECEKHEMIGCQVCNPPPPPPVPADSRPFRARYDGHCPECNLPIMAGAHRIVLRGGVSDTRAIHETCA